VGYCRGGCNQLEYRAVEPTPSYSSRAIRAVPIGSTVTGEVDGRDIFVTGSCARCGDRFGLDLDADLIAGDTP
jgi:hypothetical protein